MTEYFDRMLGSLLDFLRDYMERMLRFIVCQMRYVVESWTSVSGSSEAAAAADRGGERILNDAQVDRLRQEASCASPSSPSPSHQVCFIVSKIVRAYRGTLSAELESKMSEWRRAMLFRCEHSYALDASDHVDMSAYVDFDMLLEQIKRLLDKFDQFFVSAALVGDNNNAQQQSKSGARDDEQAEHDTSSSSSSSASSTETLDKYTDFSSDTESYCAGKHTSERRLTAIRSGLRHLAKSERPSSATRHAAEPADSTSSQRTLSVETVEAVEVAALESPVDTGDDEDEHMRVDTSQNNNNNNNDATLVDADTTNNPANVSQVWLVVLSFCFALCSN